MKKFKAIVFPSTISKAFGRWVTVIAPDAISANSQFCKYCAALDKHHRSTFDFAEFQQIDE